MADNTYTKISDLPTLESVDQTAWTPVEIAGKEGKKVDLNSFAEKTSLSDKANKSEMSISAVSGDATKKTVQLKDGVSTDVVIEHQDVSNKLDKVSDAVSGNIPKFDSNGNLIDSGVSSDTVVNVKPNWNAAAGSAAEILNKPTIPTVGKLNTTLTDTQSTSSSESLSGTVKLHKVSKTGKYSDLIQLPTLVTANNSSQLPHSGEVIDTTIQLHRISKTGMYKDLQAICNPAADLSSGSWCYWLEAQSTGGAYYEEDGDVDLILQFYTDWSYSTHFMSGLNTLYYVDYPSEYGTDDEDIPDGKRHPERDYTSLTKLTLLVNNDGDSGNIPITTFVLQRQTVSKILDVEVALYDGQTDWDKVDPPLNSITPLTCVSTLKTVDTSKPGIIRVTGEVFEILQ